MIIPQIKKAFSKQNYDALEVKKALELAYLAYELDTREIGIKLASSLGIEGFITQDEVAPYRIRIAITGTNAWQDWKVNLNFLPNNQGYHQGFWTGYLSIRKKIWNALGCEWGTTKFLEQAKAIKYPITVSGHSLGGAIAQRASIDLAGRGLDVTLITFGQPKTTRKLEDRALSKCKSYHRFYHPLDIVAHVPFTYRHSNKGNPVWFCGNPHDYRDLDILRDYI